MKGIGIMAVIAGHTNPDYISGHIIMSFHMPLFFIIAGYLYKPNHNLKTKALNDFRRLLVPYFTTSLIIMVTFFCISNDYQSIIIHFTKAIFHADTEDHTSLIWAHIPKIGPIWFLFALFWCRTTYNMINYFIPSYKIIVVISLSIIAVIIDRYLINLPFSILPGLSSMIFYLFGEHIHLYGINRSNIAFCACCWIIHLFFSRIDMCICMYKLYPIDICGAVFGTFIIYHLAKVFTKNHFLSKTLSFLGQTSLVILCAHTYEWSLNISQNFEDYIWIITFAIELSICILLTFLWLYIKYFVLFLLKKIHQC